MTIGHEIRKPLIILFDIIVSVKLSQQGTTLCMKNVNKVFCMLNGTLRYWYLIFVWPTHRKYVPFEL
jgi:hypothetical protein